jgi:hypothetical protein
MVAMFETREAAALYVREIEATPFTLVLIDARRDGEPVRLNTLKVLSAGAGLDGEPTWEDAAWQ